MYTFVIKEVIKAFLVIFEYSIHKDDVESVFVYYYCQKAINSENETLFLNIRDEIEAFLLS